MAQLIVSDIFKRSAWSIHLPKDNICNEWKNDACGGKECGNAANLICLERGVVGCLCQ
jgi:hypothetical protein